MNEHAIPVEMITDSRQQLAAVQAVHRDLSDLLDSMTGVMKVAARVVAEIERASSPLGS